MKWGKTESKKKKEKKVKIQTTCLFMVDIKTMIRCAADMIQYDEADQTSLLI